MSGFKNNSPYKRGRRNPMKMTPQQSAEYEKRVRCKVCLSVNCQCHKKPIGF